MSRNARVAFLAVLGVCFMSGLGFASVPLYRLFCQVTGFAGTPQRATSAPGAVGSRITVSFDANVSARLPWSFRPEERSQTVAVGERDMVNFIAVNRAATPITGTAGFNVTPEHAGKYFTKIQCFCFTEQTLKPGESMRMPVIFFVDPKILQDPDARDIQNITLSYTFYPVENGNAG
jgi:cytochrome c oxidase assembly protein subunit 11